MDLKQDLIDNKKIICVGTTSIRTVESLFWAGNNIEEFSRSSLVKQWSPYENENVTGAIESLDNLINYFEGDVIQGKTELIIVPGYEFRFTKGLITNFHVPKSTLLLLVSAFVGEQWKDIYKSALDNNYRFLSYGDSSLMLR